MDNARVMYLRPSNLFKEFIIERNEQAITSAGRVINQHKGNGTNILKGCLAEAMVDDRTKHSITDHIVTHTIVQSGQPKAKKTDCLILGDRMFYICDVDDTGTLGISTIYYAEERRDIR